MSYAQSQSWQSQVRTGDRYAPCSHLPRAHTHSHSCTQRFTPITLNLPSLSRALVDDPIARLTPRAPLLRRALSGCPPPSPGPPPVQPLPIPTPQIGPSVAHVLSLGPSLGKGWMQRSEAGVSAPSPSPAPAEVSLAADCGMKVPRLWSLVDLSSNPTSVTYQLGAPGCLIFPPCAPVSTPVKGTDRVHFPGSL